MQSTVDRARADGWRPSIYLCSRHRRFDDCSNKYVSDVTLGPFVLNYIANLIRVSKSFGKTTSIETFRKKLLRGEMFAGVELVAQQGLAEMYNLLKSGRGEAVFSARNGDATSDGQVEERALLLSEKRRKERGMKRLMAAYLYEDAAIPEKEFILERKRLADSLNEVDARIEELDKSILNSFNLTDDEFMNIVSRFIMEQRLTDK